MRGQVVVTGLRFIVLVSVLVESARSDSPPADDAEVTQATVEVLSGPGPGYYPTMILESGRRLTVVGAAHGDWVAVQPPPGSFSWVPTESVAEKPDGTGQIIMDSVKVRVGSALSSARHVYQVTLDRDATVRILERVPREGPGWYRIVPPANEVRYVASSQLRRPGRPDGTKGIGEVSEKGSDPLVINEKHTTYGQDQRGPTPFRPLPGVPMARRSPGIRAIPAAEPIERSQSLRLAAEQGSGPAIAIADDPAQPTAARLEALEKQLALMRTRAPSTWDLGGARTVVADLRAKLPKTAGKGSGGPASPAGPDDRLRSATEALTLLEQIQRRYARFDRGRALTQERDQALVALQARQEREVTLLARPFTAEGIVRGTGLKVDDGETYALTDAFGTTTHYVVPVAGLPVRQYLGTRVGLVGQTETRPNVPVPVLSAEQLVPLEDQMARPLPAPTLQR